MRTAICLKHAASCRTCMWILTMPKRQQSISVASANGSQMNSITPGFEMMTSAYWMCSFPSHAAWRHCHRDFAAEEQPLPGTTWPWTFCLSCGICAAFPSAALYCKNLDSSLQWTGADLTFNFNPLADIYCWLEDATASSLER